ncbi:sensor histidine kinase [Paenibacillus doosanensis]|nr:sensor histidine kinase [Paenibacillus doosanensis]
MAAFAILSLVPLLITGFFAYDRSSEAIKRKISASTIQVMNQVSENIQNELTKLENDSVDIAFSDLVQNTLISYPAMNELDKINAEVKMQNMLAKKFSFFHSVSDVLLYTDRKEKIMAYGDATFKFRLTQDYLDSILEEAAAKNGVPIWKIAGQEDEESVNARYRINNYGEAGILLSRSFKSLQGKMIGTIIIRIDEKYILAKFKDVQLGEGSDILILNSRGTVVSSRISSIKPAHVYPDASLVEELAENREKGNFSFHTVLSGKRYLVAYTYIPSADWYLVSTIPFSYLNDEPVKIGVFIAVLGIICFLLSLVLSFIVSQSISNPLYKLVKMMKSVKSGNFAVRSHDNSNDELGVAITHFNHMVSELQFLIDEVKNKEVSKRLAELKALQAQINPHFLSNTLNTVRSLANLQKAENIASIITSLIQLLHVSMGKGGERVTLRKEIEYVRAYLNIMAYRYYDKFEVHIEMEEGILDCDVLKFILQPIVENALLHGLEPMEGKGLIVIKGYRVGDELKITVTDNGVGMNELTLNRLVSEKPKKAKAGWSGIGVWNVDQRIKLYFGEKYGISIQSVPNLYTTVEITIPAVAEEVA